MKITKSKLLKIIKEEYESLDEVYPWTGTKGLSSRDKLERGPAKHRGSLEFPEDDETEAEGDGEDNFYYVNRAGDVSPGFPTMGRDPKEFAEVVLAYLKDAGIPPTVNIHKGDPFDHAERDPYAIMQIIGGEIIDKEPDEWGDDPEDILTSPDEERYLSGEDRYDESRRRINKKKLQNFIIKEVMEALK